MTFRHAMWVSVVALSVGCKAMLGSEEESPSGSVGTSDLPTGIGKQLTNEEVFRCDGEQIPTIQRRLWRLTSRQLDLTLSAIRDGRSQAASGTPSGYDYPPMLLESLGSDRFSRRSSRDSITDVEFSQIWTGAEVLAEQIIDTAAASEGSCLVGESTDTACIEATLKQLAEVLFRRPMTADEIAIYTGEEAQLRDPLGAEEALKTTIRSLIMAPHSLFRVELGVLDSDGETASLDAFELATALSFFLTDAPPDDELWMAAVTGWKDQSFEQQVDRLLTSLGSKMPAVTFLEEFFYTRKAHEVAKDPNEVPFHHPLALEEDARAWFSALLEKHAGAGFFHSLMSNSDVYAQADTQTTYGITDITDTSPVLVGSLKDQRGGALTLPAFLTAFSGMNTTHPVQRGKFISQSFLCREVPPLPIEKIPPLPDLGPNATMRDKLAAHSSGSCAGCHELMDPIGLGLEDFDHVGRFRTMEGENPLDNTGVLSDSGADTDGVFHGAVELGARLAASETADSCFVRNSYRYWLGTDETAKDACTLVDARDALRSNEGYRGLLKQLLLSETFRKRVVSAQ